MKWVTVQRLEMQLQAGTQVINEWLWNRAENRVGWEKLRCFYYSQQLSPCVFKKTVFYEGRISVDVWIMSMDYEVIFAVFSCASSKTKALRCFVGHIYSIPACAVQAAYRWATSSAERWHSFQAKCPIKVNGTRPMTKQRGKSPHRAFS